MSTKPSAHTGTVGLMVAQLRDRKEHLEKELGLINVVLEALEKAWTIDACLATDDALVNKLASEVQVRTQVPTELKGLSYADAAEHVLMRITDRRPMGTRMIIGRLDVAGKRVKGKDPYRTLYRTLLKDARFVRLEGKWALAEWYPPTPAPTPNVGEKAAEKDANAKGQMVN